MATIDDDPLGEVDRLVDTIRPFFAGVDPMVVGAALADLLSILLASHVIKDDADEIQRDQTDEMREEMIENFLRAVRNLTPVNEKIIHEKPKQ
jgi:hypothetical protein